MEKFAIQFLKGVQEDILQYEFSTSKDLKLSRKKNGQNVQILYLIHSQILC